MVLTGDIEQINKLLIPYRTGTCRIAYFSQTFRRLALILESKGLEEVIYLTGAGCEHIKGPFSFSAKSLVVKRDSENNSTIISDESAGFELITIGGVALVKGRREQFSDSLEDLILDKSELPD